MTSERDIKDRSKELPKLSDIGVFDELDPLRKVVIWGPPGPEAELAQMYPKDRSLFFDKMDVAAAREEMNAYQSILEANGVEVIKAKDVLASILPPSNISTDEMIRSLVDRGVHIKTVFYDQEALDTAEFATEINRFQENVSSLFYADVHELQGTQRAITLANAINLIPSGFPLGNSLFARDQMNVLMSKMVRSSMRKPIRKKEVPFFEDVYRELGVMDFIQIPDGESFEGGDAYIIDNVVYVGVGARTTLGAAAAIFDQLKDELDEKGFEFAIVLDPNVDKLTAKQKQDLMHIDTWSFFFGDKQVMLLPEEAARRRVLIVSHNGAGRKSYDEYPSFPGFLAERGYTVHEVPKESQENFGCNNIALDKNRVIVPTSENTSTVQILRQSGQEVIGVDLFNITQGYGAAHCITGTVLRSK